MIKDIQKNKLVQQYEPLVNKLTKQFFDSNHGLCSWNDIYSMALEGFALAINNYDPNRSSMSFTQYAAYSIRNNILTCLNEETRTVKLSAYAQKIIVERGQSTFNTVSIDHAVVDSDDQMKPREIVMNMYEDEKFSDGDIFEYLYNRLENQFNKRDCDIFYKIFGLKTYDVTPNKAVAKEYGVSEGLISQKIKKITTWIRKDNDLCEVLSNLLK